MLTKTINTQFISQDVEREIYDFIQGRETHVESEGFRQPGSVWGHLAHRLGFRNTLSNRRWLYTWYRRNSKRHNIAKKHEKKKKNNQRRPAECKVTGLQKTSSKNEGQSVDTKGNMGHFGTDDTCHSEDDLQLHLDVSDSEEPHFNYTDATGQDVPDRVPEQDDLSQSFQRCEEEEQDDEGSQISYEPAPDLSNMAHSNGNHAEKDVLHSDCQDSPFSLDPETAEPPEVYCICRQPDDGRPYVICESCEEWFHYECVNFKNEDYSKEEGYICAECQKKGTDDTFRKRILQQTVKAASVTDDMSTPGLQACERKFKCKLSQAEWETIKPAKESTKLQKEWTSMIAEKFAQKNNVCVLKFTYHHVKKVNSRKTKGPYVRISAACKFTGCAKFTMSLKKCPTPTDKMLNFRVIQKGDINHNQELHQKRHTKGKERKQIGQSLKSESVGSWYYSRIAEMEELEKAAGNLNKCKTPQVLWKLLSESRNEGQLHPDPLQEVLIIQNILRDIVNSQGSQGVTGVVQYFACNPFEVHMYTEKQLQLYRDQLRVGNVVLYLDATGSLISKLPGQDKKVFYYALVMKNPVQEKCAIPLAELISNDQKASEIRHFLARVFHAAAAGRPLYTVIPKQIETDFSWAMIQSALSAINSEDCKSYLKRAWKFVQGDSTWKGYTVLHLCAAHVIKDVAKHAVRVCADKGVRQFFLYCFGLLQTAADLDVARKTFRHMCHVFCLPSQSSTYKKSLTFLKEAVQGQNKSEVDSAAQDDAQDCTTGIDDTEVLRFATIKESSDWRQAFMHIYNDVQDDKPSGDISQEDNTYFNSALMKVLLDNFMHIFPLWSGVLLGNLQRYSKKEEQDDLKNTSPRLRSTNALVENWFGVVKKDFLPSKRFRMRPGAFIQKSHLYIQGRLGELELFGRKMEQKPVKRSLHVKDPTESKKKEEEGQVKEKWSKSKKKKREGKYFSPAKTIPQPKHTSTPKKKQDNVPSWGGQVVYKGKEILITNTCPLDNLLLVLFLLHEDSDLVKSQMQESSSAVARSILTVFDACRTGDWSMAKFLWLRHICKYEIQMHHKQTFDVYGSEHEVVTKHLAFMQENIQISTCTSDDCPRKRRFSTTSEVVLW